MNKAVKRRIIAILLSVSFIVIFAFSLSYLIAHEHHDCIGEHCPVCATIQASQKVLKTLIVLAGVSSISGILTLSKIGRSDRFQSFDIAFQTLKTLQVQMNN